MDRPKKEPEENTDDEEENVQGAIYNEEIPILVLVTFVLVLILLH